MAGVNEVKKEENAYAPMAPAILGGIGKIANAITKGTKDPSGAAGVYTESGRMPPITYQKSGAGPKDDMATQVLSEIKQQITPPQVSPGATPVAPATPGVTPTGVSPREVGAPLVRDKEGNLVRGKEWYEDNRWRVSGGYGETPLAEQPTATRITKGVGGKPSLLQAYEIPELAKTPEQMTAERLKVAGVGSETELMIQKLKSDPNNYEEGTFDRQAVDEKGNKLPGQYTGKPGYGVKPKGLKKDVLKAIVELQTGKMTSEAAGAGHAVNAAHSAEQIRLAREKQAFEIHKFDKEGSLKDPMNYMKALEMFSPYIKDETGVESKNKDYEAGMKNLEEAGYPRPQGMKSSVSTKLAQNLTKRPPLESFKK